MITNESSLGVGGWGDADLFSSSSSLSLLCFASRAAATPGPPIVDKGRAFIFNSYKQIIKSKNNNEQNYHIRRQASEDKKLCDSLLLLWFV